MMDLIYCAGANRRLTQIAHDAGYLLGVRSDKLDYDFPISFVDIDYKQPDFEQYLRIVAKLQPKYAVVPDLSDVEVSEQDIERVIKQAERLSCYCQIPLIVPKLSAQIPLIPAQWSVAYSLPTRYGGAKYGVWKLQDRRVHLLGGSPHEQMKLYRYMPECVQSVDGNMAQLMAVKFAKYWQDRKWLEHPRRKQGLEDLYLECWQWSCANIHQHWLGLGVN